MQLPSHILLALAAFLASAAAQTTTPALTAIHLFTDQNGDGAYPFGNLALGPNGTLYGMTNQGGGSSWGTVFELQPPTSTGGNWTEIVLLKFNGTNGGNPMAGLLRTSNGALYGSTTLGGASPAYGIVFELKPPSTGGGQWTEKIIHNFLGAPDGGYPTTNVVEGPHGALYGTTYSGGTSQSCFSGCGTVFELTPPSSPGGTWTESVLFSFPGGTGGEAPNGVIVSANGKLYGTTPLGGAGGVGCCGIAYELAPPATPGGAWTQTVLHTFACCGADGYKPEGSLLYLNGSLYGTTLQGGAHNQGTVFQLSPPASSGAAWTETILHSFGGPGDGGLPESGLIAGKNGVLYGTTSASPGTIYQIAPPATSGGSWTETVLASLNYTDGAAPYDALILGSSGALYGTANQGGIQNCSYGCGTVFQLIP
jgi:uncharacterized repeat protein (TIGR03803 family)